MGDAMEQHNPFKFAVHLPKSYPSDLASIQTLIQGCHNQDRMALEELLSRYTRHFIGTIVNTFVGVNRKDLAGKRDILYDVYIQIVDKILEKGLKADLTPMGLAGYLREMAHNETITWLRKQSRKKSVIITLEEVQTISLQMPIGTEGAQTLEGTVPGDGPTEQETSSRIQEEVAGLLAGIADMEPPKRLIFKVYLMFYDSLSDADIREIARSRNESVKKVRAELKALQEKLLKREAMRVRYQDVAGITWYLVQKLERRIVDLKQDSHSGRVVIAGLEEELEHQRKRHEEFSKKAAGIVRPKNEEICRLLGLDAQDKTIVKGISLKIFRIRKELRDARSAQAGSG